MFRCHKDRNIHISRIVTFYMILSPKQDVEKVFLEASLYERRIVWDDGIESNRYVKRFSGQYDIVSYTTHSALGGVIKPRLFVDCRLLKMDKSRGEYVNCCVSWDSHDVSTKGFVVGKNLPGSGLSVHPVREDVYQWTMIGQTDLGGWLPTSVTNGPTTDAYMKIAQGVVTRVEAWGGIIVFPQRD